MRTAIPAGTFWSFVNLLFRINRELERFMRIISLYWLLLASSAAADEAFVTAVLDCRSLSAPEERLVCYDGVVAGHSGRDTAPAAANAAEPAAVESEELFGMSPAAAQRALEESVGREPIDRVEATIVGLTAVEPNKVAVALDNGQVWRQTIASSLRLSEGDDVVIRRRSLGSHTLQKAGSARSMKVKRVR